MKFKKILRFLRNEEEYDFHYKDTFRLILALMCFSSGSGNLSVESHALTQRPGTLSEVLQVIIWDFVVSLPLMFQELGLAQYSGKGSYGLWDMSPMWRGIVYMQIPAIVLNIITSYLMTAYNLHYAFGSLSEKPAWTICPKDFNITDRVICYSPRRKLDSTRLCIARYGVDHCKNISWQNPTDYYWNTKFAGSRKGHNIETFIPLVLILPFLFLTIRKSALSIQFVAPVLIFTPIIFHLALMVVTFTLPGISDGQNYYLTFNWDSFFTFRRVESALENTVRSLSFGMGGYAVFGSHSPFRSPVNLVSYTVILAHFSFTMITFLSTVNLIGVASHIGNAPIKRIRSYVLLAFGKLPLALHWGFNENNTYWVFIMFFANFLCFFRHLAALVDVLLNVLYERFPKLRNYSNLSALSSCIVLFMLSFPMSIPSVQTFVTFTLDEVVNPTLQILAFYQIFVVAFFYGVNNLRDDIYFMLGFPPANLWLFSWNVTGVILVVFYIVYMHYIDTKWGAANMYRKWHNSLPTGVLIVTPIIYCVCYVIVKRRKGWPWGFIFRPSQNWGPQDEILKKSRDMFSSSEMTHEYLYRQRRLKHSAEKQRLRKSTQANIRESSSSLLDDIHKQLSLLKLHKSSFSDPKIKVQSDTSRFLSLVQIVPPKDDLSMYSAFDKKEVKPEETQDKTTD